jgi:single-strand DNA-binding protein
MNFEIRKFFKPLHRSIEAGFRKALFLPHQKIIITLNGQVAKIVAIEILRAFFGCVNIGVVLKTKTCLNQFLAAGFGRIFSLFKKRSQCFSVFFKSGIHLPHQHTILTVLLVVVGIAAPIIAKFFVATAFDGLVAAQAMLFCCFHNLLIFRQYTYYFPFLNGYKRFYADLSDYLPTSEPSPTQFCIVNRRKTERRILNKLNFKRMNSLRNKVQLIGRLGANPEVKNLDAQKKMARFSIATSETYKNAKGEKVTDTQWHNITLWDKQAELAEKYMIKGTEVAIDGKLVNRNYTDKDGVKRYVVDIQVNDILLLSGKPTEKA